MLVVALTHKPGDGFASINALPLVTAFEAVIGGGPGTEDVVVTVVSLVPKKVDCTVAEKVAGKSGEALAGKPARVAASGATSTALRNPNPPAPERRIGADGMNSSWMIFRGC
jgi:hypothetical protein